MDAVVIEALFEPFAKVQVRRMFGGHGIYADGLFFALEAGGEVFLKADPETKERFLNADSRPFVYAGGQKPMTMAYWLLPEAAHDDAEELAAWCRLALDAAQRAAVAKAGKQPRTKKPGVKRGRR